MLVLEWKGRAFIEKVNSRCFCWFPAAILVDSFCPPIWRLHTKLYKGAWNVSANNSETVGQKDQRFGQIVYILVFYNLSFFWLLPLDGFYFIFLCRVYCVTGKTKNLEHHKTLFLVFFFFTNNNKRKNWIFYFVKITKISSCWVIVVSNRESRKRSWRPLSALKEFETFSTRHYLQKEQSSSREELLLAVLWWLRLS